MTAGALTELPDLAQAASLIARPDFAAGRLLRLPVAAGALMPAPRPLLAGTEAFCVDWLVQWHRRPAAMSRDLACYFATDATISGSGQIWLDGRLVTSPELMPGYVYRHHLGLPADPAAVLRALALPVRVIEAPCVVMPGPKHVYGHFLIETLFSVLLARRVMRGTGEAWRVLLPDDSPTWLRRILHDDLGIPARDVEQYRSASERVLLRRAVLPALLHRGDSFHPLANELLADLLETLGDGSQPPGTGRRLFLVRGDIVNPHSDYRLCTNEAALAALAASRHGFVPVAMQTLPWRAQLVLLREAEIVLGVCGSALHAALFSPAETRVAALGNLNLVQSSIAALRGHRMAYLTRGVLPRGRFAVDEAAFAGFLDAVCADAGGATPPPRTHPPRAATAARNG